jgi:antitoxin component of MazEF toxin-antitoxin module
MPVFESSRKVQVMGSSLAMTLPALFVKANEIEKGNEMNVIYCLDGVLVLSRFEDYNDIRDRLMKILDNLDEKIKGMDSG